MNDREELEALRRLAELEAKAGGGRAAQETAEWAKTVKPDDPGAVGAAMIGTGREFERLWHGAQQILAGATGDRPKLDELARLEREAQGVIGPLQRDRPISTAIGGALPYAAVPVGAGLGTTMGVAAVLEGLKYGTAGERAQSAVLGGTAGGIGHIGGRVLGNVLSPVSRASGTQQEAVNVARGLGMRPSLSQVTGGKFAAQLEDMAANTPGGAGVIADFAAANKAAASQAAARSIGEAGAGKPGKSLRPELFGRAADRIGQVFEDIKALGKIKVGERVVDPIAINTQVGKVADDVLRQQSKMIPQEQNANLIQLAKQAKTLAQNNGRIDGETYQLIRSGLTNASFEASGDTARHYAQLRTALDNSAERSLKEAGYHDLAASLRSARPQYANLKTLEKGTVAEAGNVNLQKLATSLRTRDPSGFREGRAKGELYDLARIGESLKPVVPGSQTHGRTLASNPLSTIAGAAYSYPAAKLATSPTVTRLAGLLSQLPAAEQRNFLGNAAGKGLLTGEAERQISLYLGLPVVPE